LPSGSKTIRVELIGVAMPVAGVVLRRHSHVDVAVAVTVLCAHPENNGGGQRGQC
jgi:hypothetical protein